MKIILTAHQFLPDYSAGTEILTFDTAKELLKRGHQVEVWTGFPSKRELLRSERFDYYEYDGIPVYRFHHVYNDPVCQANVIEAEYNNLFFAERFREHLGKQRPDIVHFFHLGRLSASPIDVCMSLNIPTVFTPTDFWFVCPMNQLRLSDNSLCLGPSRSGENCLRHVVEISQPNNIKKGIRLLPKCLLTFLIWAAKRNMWPNKYYSSLVTALAFRPNYLKQVFNKFDRVLVPTRLMERILEINEFNCKNIKLVPYGINLSHIDSLPPKIAEEEINIGFIGTLYVHKGVHILLQAVKKIPADVPIKVYVYGNLNEFPDYVKYLKNIVGNDHRVFFCGTFPNNKIGKVFSNLDLLVVPSIWYENSPLVIYSAQATGTPVIATNLGGMAEVIHHEHNGLLFEKEDVEGLKEAILRVCQNRNLLTQLSSNSVKPKSIPQYVDELEKVYKEIIAEKGQADLTS